MSMQDSNKHLKLAMIKQQANNKLNLDLPLMMAVLEELDAAVDVIGDYEEVEDIDKIPDSPYKEVLKRYPDLLKQSFNEDSTKNNIKHKIPTGNTKPCKAKPRRLLPG